MNLFETLREFKKVEPDSSFTEKSKRAILATQQNIPSTSPFRGVLRFIETGAAVVLAGFFIILITGAFSNSGSIVPVQYSVINPAALNAEAQAIDVQIQLAHVSYAEGAPKVAPAVGSTPFAAAATSSALSTSMTAVTSSVAAVASAATSATSSAATSTTVSVDQALLQLTR